ncbi:MAG: hypothetical protein ACFFBD_21280 [Candidatus Hodarchaeota archaeon]
MVQNSIIFEDKLYNQDIDHSPGIEFIGEMHISANKGLWAALGGLLMCLGAVGLLAPTVTLAKALSYAFWTGELTLLTRWAGTPLNFLGIEIPFLLEILVSVMWG